MIQLFLGNIGSGKTAAAVREIANNPTTAAYTNIDIDVPHALRIKTEHIIQKEVIGEKKDGTPVYQLACNAEYWKNLRRDGPIDIWLDEAHTILNPRRSMSKVNVVMTDWLALLRRIIGSAESGSGKVVFITQLWRRVDTIAREMAHQIRYHRCTYKATCPQCGAIVWEDSDMPEHKNMCSCGHIGMVKSDHVIEVWCFAGMDKYLQWDVFGTKTYYKHYAITDIAKYFPLYDTLQWNDLLTDLDT
jgi:hypothetical protein